MSLIAAAAYVLICAHCQSHACIVLSDGTKTRQFVSKNDGLLVLASLKEKGLVSPEEAKILEEQIRDSKLLRYIPLAEEVIAKIVELDAMDELINYFHSGPVPVVNAMNDFIEEVSRS